MPRGHSPPDHGLQHCDRAVRGSPQRCRAVLVLRPSGQCRPRTGPTRGPGAHGDREGDAQDSRGRARRWLPSRRHRARDAVPSAHADDVAHRAGLVPPLPLRRPGGRPSLRHGPLRRCGAGPSGQSAGRIEGDAGRRGGHAVVGRQRHLGIRPVGSDSSSRPNRIRSARL